MTVHSHLLLKRYLAPLALLAIAICAACLSHGLRIWSETGPGAGLFPFSASCGIALMCLVWMAQASSDASASVRFDRLGSIVCQLALLGLFAFVMNTLGFIAAAVLVVAGTALLTGERNWIAIALLSVGTAFGVQYLFGVLGTPL
ncbi:tripartite tricarboxylate transporter TctB family protein [Ensifer sp. YR511]|uniref:tripartite tricarboxylate transporter TctB family protein n=1 Tax=Ensifer sp. YR511 TaxID=1855294 RepID=UPI0008893BC4|nr:tripartite tricarboxylate transporter TctB family protein [Ensifer sp. YR511]SDN73476.1 Tripartite tricarboxylate transporter TctB family protein [Ensifer sp. YR511]